MGGEGEEGGGRNLAAGVDEEAGCQGIERYFEGTELLPVASGMVTWSVSVLFLMLEKILEAAGKHPSAASQCVWNNEMLKDGEPHLNFFSFGCEHRSGSRESLK